MSKGNIKTVALSEEQFNEIINTMNNGCSLFRPNNKIATALVLEANLGLRISDIVTLKLSSIVKDGDRYRLDIKEKKTDKARTFTVNPTVYCFIMDYVSEHGIKKNEYLFPHSDKNRKYPITTAAVQKHLRTVCDYLGYGDLHISTHSFRKFFATRIYEDNDYNLVLVQRLLQHCSPSVTQRYIGIGSKDLESAIENSTILPSETTNKHSDEKKGA